jgi:L-lysine 2,3-aminomutase
VFVNIPDLLDENQIMPYYIHHSNDIGKAYHYTAAKMFVTLSLPSEIYLNTRSNAVGCCECHFYWFLS